MKRYYRPPERNEHGNRTSPRLHIPLGKQRMRDVVSDACDDLELPHRRVDQHHGADGVGWAED